MDLHPAENRGYRELFLTARAAGKRLERLVGAFQGRDEASVLEKAADAVVGVVRELRPLLAAHDLHSRPAAEGGGVRIGGLRGAVMDRFLERNQALRFAVCDVEHVANLLGYLATASETRGDGELPEACRRLERRVRRHAGALRRASIELGSDPDFAVKPVDESPAGRAAHGVTWALGTVGEWTDRRASRRARTRE